MNLKQTVENVSNTKFNSCLLNLYHDGNEGIGWHSDDEKSIGDNSPIASVSIGAERKFSFKHKQSKKIILILLEHVSLLLIIPWTIFLPLQVSMSTLLLILPKIL